MIVHRENRKTNGSLDLALPDGDLRLFPAIDFAPTGKDMLSRLQASIPWRQESITLFGRTHAQPRLICWMGDAGCTYRYSGRTWHPEPWDSLVADLRSQVEGLTGERFNSALLNLYRNGSDSMGFHADDEPELGKTPVIASLSFGAERVMHFRHRHDHSLPTRKIALPDGSLLVMRGETQANWRHAIPKTRRPVGPRINLTFRRIMI
ncbi:MAG: alpha-ketoglutarate-dependent dioxygenase AlkB [Sphingomonadales bacterium]|nr:MAG: alpha-ketoglutarate-dependent dioxygenase AlkB [Sphingomonadales bacterium]TNF03536.1 MAG: alpha-ketoglutarate-dependent dioxygenase AlkB [Sphingomonadales bacterium]